MKFSIYQASRMGGRKYNQDRVAYAYSSQALLLVLADGMGGHLHGEVAAQLAIQTYVQAFEKAAQPHILQPEEFLKQVMQDAHTAIIRYAHEQQLEGSPGTTCVVALVQDSKVYWAHAGDSRFYLIREGKVLTRTRDHSVVQQWADWGIIEANEMRTHPDRNKITNCLGAEENMFFVESAEARAVLPGDYLMLCSDGLWGPLSGQEIARAVSAAPLPVALEKLMDKAIADEGSHADNTTAVAACWGVAEAMQPASVPVTVVLDCA